MRPDSFPVEQYRLKLVESSTISTGTAADFAPVASTIKAQVGEGMTSAVGHFARFIKERVYLKNVSPRTVEWYEESFKWLRNETPSQEDVNDFVIRMREKGLSPASCNNRIRAVRAYLKWRKLALNLNYMQEEEKPLPTYGREAIRKTINFKPSTAQQKRTHTIMMLMLDSGLRLQEALCLQVQDLDFDSLLIGVRGKGKKYRPVPMSEKMKAILQKFIGKRIGFLFATADGKKLSARNALRDVKELCEAMGFRAPARTIHALRHTMATDYIRNGGNVVKLQRILGHSRVTTTMRYVHLQGDDLVEEHERVGILSTDLRKKGPSSDALDNQRDVRSRFSLTSVTRRTKVASF